ncbi:MAG: TraX family protein [Alphaproteobacteria bacterium]
MLKKIFRMNQDILKILAVVAMTIDHAAKIFQSEPSVGAVLIGRISFPIFSYLLMMHLFEKKCFLTYFKRLSFFGIITSGVLFVFGWSYNVLITFLTAVLSVWCFGMIQRQISNQWLKKGLYFFAFTGGLFVSFFWDFSVLGYIYLLGAYGWFKYKNAFFGGLILLFGALINLTDFYMAGVSLLTTAALMKIGYSSNRIIKNKYLFYIYYPLHLFVLLSARNLFF